MDISFVKTPAIQDLLDRVAGTATDKGDPRVKAILRDLVDIAATVKHSSIVQDVDTGVRAVDTKALMAYLKTVAEITNIYKMESMRSLK